MSIHCNAANGSAKGAETYYFADSRAGRKLANHIQWQLINSLPLVDRGIKTDNFVVLTNTIMPAVLVETAFIDNLSDAALLLDKHFIEPATMRVFSLSKFIITIKIYKKYGAK